MLRKYVVILAAIWGVLALQGQVVGGELAVKTIRPTNRSAARYYIGRNYVGEFEKVDAESFSLPAGAAFRAEIQMGRAPKQTPVTLLFTYSGKDKKMPDELRVAVGTQKDFSNIQAITAEAPGPLLSGGRAQARFANVKITN